MGHFYLHPTQPKHRTDIWTHPTHQLTTKQTKASLTSGWCCHMLVQSLNTDVLHVAQNPPNRTVLNTMVLFYPLSVLPLSPNE